MSATMSLLGLYRKNNNLFLELELPEGIERDTVVDNLLMETAELEVLFTNPLFMQTAIGTWSSKELPVWQKLYDTTLLKYNPIQNYDRTEKWSEDENTTKNTDSEATGTSKTESDGTSKQNRDTTIDNATNHFTSAYNETDFTPTGRDQQNQQEIGETTQTDEGNVNVSAKSGNVTDETGKRFLDRSGEISGNTGFYTKQKMIEQERNIAMFNVIDHIINSFKNRFCLQIY